MPTNTLSGFGLRPVMNRVSASPTYQGSPYKIRDGYATQINYGDLVKMGTGTNHGYVVLSTLNDNHSLGVFMGCMPFYDQTFGSYINQQGWPGTNNTADDVDVWVMDDFNVEIEAQMEGAWSEAYRFQNINFKTGTNGLTTPVAPAFISGLYLDSTTISLDPVLPFKILGLAPFTPGSTFDPDNTNPVLRVKLNTSELLSSLGV